MAQRRGREIALQILYKLDIDSSVDLHNLQEIDAVILDHTAFLSKKTQEQNFAYLIVKGVSDHLEEIDAMIESAAENWTLSRLSVIDRNILRVAGFEMVFVKETPPPVVINEAIEVAKRFGSEQSGKFINGVMDRMLKNLKHSTHAVDSNDEGLFDL